MTTPGGVPNLPMGALTLDTMAAKLQDMSGTAMKTRAVERFPSIMDNSTGLSPALDITPFGILTRIWAEVNSLIANSDPADIQGPEDIPELLLEFIEGLPFVGQFVDLLEAILGTYDGTDQTLLTIQQIFGPIREFVQFGADSIQQLIDILTSGFSGLPSTGNDPAALAFAVLGLPAQIAGQFLQGLSALFAGQATTQAQVNALQNGGFTDNLTTLTGWTNLVGTLAMSTRGPYLQTPNIAVAVRNTDLSSDKHGAHIVIRGLMQGICRVGICSNSSATNRADLEIYRGFDGDALRIVTAASPTLVVPHMQVDLLGSRLADGDALDFWYEPSINTFHAVRNTVPVLDWPDLTNIVTHGGSKRRVVLTSNGGNRNEDSYYGPGIDVQVTGYVKT